MYSIEGYCDVTVGIEIARKNQPFLSVGLFEVCRVPGFRIGLVK